MAKSQLRSHREAKKPKKTKPPIAPATSFVTPAKPNTPTGTKH
ncbi:hypothetical protein [Andreprevotia chitinilytica]|nr:hypothetical protein [Andreprevotia chitinilytica]